MRSFLSSFISLIYPRTCLGCDRPLVDHELNICLHCRLDLPLTNYHKLEENPLMAKMINIPHLKNIFAYLKYEKRGLAQKLLRELKYEGNQELGVQLGRSFAAQLKKEDLDSKIDMIIPIPLHKSRLRKRGFNQAEEIAMGFGEILNIKLETKVMSRIKQNTAQAKQSRLDRWQNAEQLFHVNDPSLLENQSVLILDDVITTGATIESAALVIANCKPKSIFLACLATGK